MRIISWNCNMSFARKRDLVMAFQPDVLIIEEVSKKDIEETQADFKHWVGSNPHKGLAILAFGQHDYRVSELYTNELPWFIPLEIRDLNIHILGLWAHVISPGLRYVRLTHAAIEHYATFIAGAPTIIAGDFNSNTIWDREHGGRSHSSLVDRLNELGLKSVYHELNNEVQGLETANTLYMYRHAEKGYHIDYAFVPAEYIAEATLSIGLPAEWLSVSDHMPLILDVLG